MSTSAHGSCHDWWLWGLEGMRKRRVVLTNTELMLCGSTTAAYCKWPAMRGALGSPEASHLDPTLVHAYAGLEQFPVQQITDKM